MEKGYYYIRFKGDSEGTIGYYNQQEEYSWECIGSDEIFNDIEIDVLGKVDIPNHIVLEERK